MNLCVFGECFHRLRVDGRPKRIRKFTFTIVCVYNRLHVECGRGIRVIFLAGIKINDSEGQDLNS